MSTMELETRLAVIEARLEDTREQISIGRAIKDDIEIMRSTFETRLARLGLRIYVAMIAQSALILGIMAKGFGWL